MLIYDKYIINFNDIYPIHRKYIVVLKIHYLKYRSGRFHYSKNIFSIIERNILYCRLAETPD